MNRHQVLTGACNSGDQCYAVGSVEGIHFTAYAAGCDIVILASDFQRVQIIPGVTHGNVKVNCLDCSTDTGKIAASYQSKVYIFEPTPLLHHESTHKLDYHWYQTATFEAECFINCLSWNLEGAKLLTGGDVIQIWQLGHEFVDEVAQRNVKFSVGHDEEDRSHSANPPSVPDQSESHTETQAIWDCIWKCRPATSVYHLKFSPDGLLFASAGKADRLVKIWYEDRKVQLHPTLCKADSIVSPKKEELHYSFVYIAHPRAVTGFSWRKTSKYMPRGSVANMLVTSCTDNVCRLWCETILPDDGLVDLEQFDPNATLDPKFHSHRHKKRFIQRLKTIRRRSEPINRKFSELSEKLKFTPSNSDLQYTLKRTLDLDDILSFVEDNPIRHAIHKRRKHTKFGPDTIMSMPNFSTVNSVASVHDFHKFSIHNNGICPALHFHLAASINPETDIPLLPVVGSKGDLQHNFQLHWLNNKELQFTMEAESILQDLHRGTLYEDSHKDSHSDSQDFLGSDSDHSPEQSHLGPGDDHTDGDGHTKKKKHKIFKKRKKHHHKTAKDLESGLGSHSNSMSSLTSDPPDHASEGTGSSYTGSPEVSGSVIDALDRRIEGLLRDWHQNADMLFSIHPVDGSFLVWLVDWLDEYNPYCFRQAQVSFSSRLPHAFPVPDARTMASNLLMYCNYSKMDIKSAMKISDNRFSSDSSKITNQPAPATGKCSPGQNDNMLIPNVLLITKHLNGSLNQWQVSFSDNSKFSVVVSVAHASRACGHRFRTNSAECHPALPLLLTTSHHNVPKEEPHECEHGENCPRNGLNGTSGHDSDNTGVGGIEFCSELILWRVDPVGPLSKSGGIVELARINSPTLSAFENVAWVPTLLPSSTLGACSNSPSALFVASDGESLRLYQAVIDARTLLLEMGSQRKEPSASFSSNTSSGYSVETPKAPGELFNIVSLQSSSRPGCIIELESIADAKNWQQTQLLHVFQEQMVTGRPGINAANMEAIVDLRNTGSFSEHFYLVLLEKNKEGGSTLHMWKITISSQPGTQVEGTGEKMSHYVPDYNIIEDDGSNPPSRSGTPEPFMQKPTAIVKLMFSATKVVSQKLPLPDNVEVLCATVAAGHLSSASIYPACLAPYLIVTACSDGEVRFWTCDMSMVDMGPGSGLSHVSLSTTSFEVIVEEEDSVRKPSVSHFTHNQMSDVTFAWREWKMLTQTQDSSSIKISGHPITIKCAYSGRVAIGYRLGAVRATQENPSNKFVNLYVAIYECESTGGSEWILEDTIELKNIHIPDLKAEIDLNLIYNLDHTLNTLKATDEELPKVSPSSSIVNMTRTKSVPSLSTIYSVRKCISEQGNTLGILQQKHLIQLDWVSTEDGSHVLTIGVGPKVLMFSQVSNDIAQSSRKDNVATDSTSLRSNKSSLANMTSATQKRAVMQKSKSMIVENVKEVIRWMKLRSVELSTADGLPPLPMHMSWVRAGILVVGMDNEMHVYSQWRGSSNDVTTSELEKDKRCLDEASLSGLSVAALPTKKTTATFKPSYSMPSFKHLQNTKLGSDTNLPKFNLTKTKSESTTSLSAVQEFGLFEAARLANPVLPQYHPKMLMELLSFGKIRRVKAILAHLVRCIAGGNIHHAVVVDEMDGDESKLGMGRQRGISISGGSPGDIPTLSEDPIPDYKEISSIPPLPIYALLAADEDTVVSNVDVVSSQTAQNASQDYTELFDIGNVRDEELDLNVFSSSADSRSSQRQRMPSSSTTPYQNPNHFDARLSHLLTKHLTHAQLPGLSSLDQMYLLALADTVAKTKTDFADHFESDSKSGMHVTESMASVNPTAESIDDCGLRFLLAIRHHIYLIRTLPPGQRVVLQQQGIKTSNIVWAFHSEATEELLTYIPNMAKGEPTWDDLKQFGAGLWVKNIAILRRCIEKVAKTAFQRNQDPMDASLFYLAMKKKNVLWGLYRSVNDKRMQDFFKQDFSLERWRKAALKNAFALLGRQRFAHAAGFFLLAGSLNDAIEVCLDKLHDIQLAIVISRLYAGDEVMPESVKKILYTHVLGCDEKGDNSDPHKAHPDPFLRSMALWLLKDHRESLNTLLWEATGQIERENNELEEIQLPSVFNFYNYLRTHPLLVRQIMASAAPKLRKQSVIAGFTRQQTIAMDDTSVCVDKVTPTERRLFFITAHNHFKNGCPLLALEVLSKLPPVTEECPKEKISNDPEKLNHTDSCITTGTIGSIDSSKQINSNDSTSSLDWSQPVTANKETVDSMDWSSPMTNGDTTTGLDWGTPISRFDLDERPDFKLSSDEEDEAEDDDIGELVSVKKPKLQKIPTITIEDVNEIERQNELERLEEEKEKDKSSKTPSVDIFAQQYTFIACLKVLMEEMHTLATGFEVDGGQLRFQLYIWLEREVEALQYLCNYGRGSDDLSNPILQTSELNGDSTLDDSAFETPSSRLSGSYSNRSTSSGTKATLHEVILAEKMDFEAKLERMSKRKQWLKTHHQLLRTLSSYCVLQGSGGGGLASVHMELLLLLQELQQEKPQQQLLSPLPFPTTLPLLSASIASSKTVTADPIQYLQCMTQDLLHSIIELNSPPGIGSSMNTVLVMRNLCIALSACVYQCLCDCDSFIVSLNENHDASLEGFTSHNFHSNTHTGHLMAGVQRYRRRSSVGDNMINTAPSKWPGVTSLRVLIAREKDEDSQRLNILLSETLIAVYASLLVNALATYDCHMLYRLVAHRFEQQMWAAFFGGGVKTVVKPATGNSPLPMKPGGDDLSKQRMKLHMKVIGSGGGGKDRTTYKESFVPPEISMVTFFMTKPFQIMADTEFSYDSEESLTSDEEDDDDDEDDTFRPHSLPLSTVQQHTDPTSYSWCLIRYSVVKLVLHNLQAFLPQVGIELPELPVCSPLMHAVFKMLEQWMEVLQGKLELFAGPPEEYIAGLHLDVVNGVPISKYKALLHPSNSPFVDNHSTLPIKRLWFHLIKQEPLRDVFLRYIYRKKQLHHHTESKDSSSTWDVPDSAKFKDPMKVVHKEQDIITAFALNQANANCVALATQKEIVELDVGALLQPPAWLEDENEMDIEFIRNPLIAPSQDNTEFFVVQSPSDVQTQQQTGSGSSLSSPLQTSASTPTFPQQNTPQTGRGTNVVKGIHFPGITNPQFSQYILDRSRRLLKLILRRPVAGIRRIGSHPALPHYLTGSADGSVRLYEWGHIQPLTMLRQPGAFPKVTKVLFNAQGNKCCVSDAEGDICLWQVGIGTSFNKPIMSLKCHNKTTSDFTFVGSSSLIATAGHSSESRNVCLWDTLLPIRSACVHSFVCHEHGCPAIVYAPHHQLLISGGRKGEICIFDIRQRQIRHTFQAHDSSIRCLAIDPEEEYFVTGSAEGDIKVWGLDIHQLIVSFQGEHSKTTFFRNMGAASGVTQLAIGSGHNLFSCGVDGSMKFRALPERDSIVRYWSAS